MSVRRIAVLSGGALVAVSCLLGMEQRESGNQTAGEPLQYAARQLEIAQEGLRQIEQGIEQGAVSPIDPQYAAWSERVVEAQRSIGDAEAYRRALQEHVRRLERIVEARDMFRRRGAITELQMLEVEYFLAAARHQLALSQQASTGGEPSSDGRATQKQK